MPYVMGLRCAVLAVLLAILPPSAQAADCGSKDSSPASARRLSNREYTNTVYDLLGAKVKWGDLPIEGYHDTGFDSMSVTLAGMNAMMVQRYLETAEAAAAEAVKKAKPDFKRLLPRLFRRPVTPDEIVRFQKFAREKGAAQALTAALMSPEFLFRVEAAQPRAYRRAHDLAFYLWGSVPDDQLFALAENGKILEPEVFQSEAERLILDQRKSRRFQEGFFSALFRLHDFNYVTKDKKLNLTPAVQSGMRLETEAFLDHLIRANRPIEELIAADYTFLTRPLAAHYGLKPPARELAQVTLDESSGRRGILTQGLILAVSSGPGETSPIQRGRWIQDLLMCGTFIPRPNKFEPLVTPAGKKLSFREKLEMHSTKPACTGCHRYMDPMGFGLEAFSGSGQFRTHYADGFAVDTAGKLPKGKSFKNARELAQVLSEDERFTACFSERLFSYALGRELNERDRCEIAAAVKAGGGRKTGLRDLMIAVAEAVP